MSEIASTDCFSDVRIIRSVKKPVALALLVGQDFLSDMERTFRVTTRDAIKNTKRALSVRTGYLWSARTKVLGSRSWDVRIIIRRDASIRRGFSSST